MCGQLNIGLATDVRNTLDTQGPYFQTGGARLRLLARARQRRHRRVQGDAAVGVHAQAASATTGSCGGATVDAADARAVPGEHPDGRRGRRGDRQPRHAGAEHDDVRRRAAGSDARQRRPRRAADVFSPTSRNRTIALRPCRRCPDVDDHAVAELVVVHVVADAQPDLLGAARAGRRRRRRVLVGRRASGAAPRPRPPRRGGDRAPCRAAPRRRSPSISSAGISSRKRLGGR